MTNEQSEILATMGRSLRSIVDRTPALADEVNTFLEAIASQPCPTGLEMKRLAGVFKERLLATPAAQALAYSESMRRCHRRKL